MTTSPPWLDGRIRAYGAALGASPDRIETARQAAARAPTPAAALAIARTLLVGLPAPACADHAPGPGTNHQPGETAPAVSESIRAAPADFAWAGVLAAAQGLAGDPQRAWVAQDLALARTSIAARPFRRRPLRRLISGLLLRPLAGLLRPAQLLSGRVAE